MKFKFKRKESEKMMLMRLFNVLLFTFFCYQRFSEEIIADELNYIIIFVIAMIIIFTLIRGYLKMNKLIILDLTESNLRYYYFRNKIEKKSIQKIDLVHGHVNSFALVFMKNQPKLKFYQLQNIYYNYKYGTPYLINLDKIEGDVCDIYKKIVDWK